MNKNAKIMILHLAVDYNTHFRSRTTTAVEWLVHELNEFENTIIALRRSTHLDNRIRKCPDSNLNVFDMPYFGLPFGICLHAALKLAAHRVITLIKVQGIKPDVVHAHKFSIEGVIGYYIAEYFDIPLIVSLRGEVETKIFRFKPMMRRQLRKVAFRASYLYFVSAWFEGEFNYFVPNTQEKQYRLPNIVRNIKKYIRVREANNYFIVIMNLNTHKRKGLRWLLDAVVLACREVPRFRLEIVGGGSQRSVEAVKKMIRVRRLEEIVRMSGPIPNDELLSKIPDYRGLAMPSLNETFGMVYVEALFSGIPVIYTQGTAVDGYLNGLKVGIAVPPRDVRKISAALLEIWHKSDEFRENISNSSAALFEIFDPDQNIRLYKRNINNLFLTSNDADFR